jgi:N-acetylneuraminic acid mutarotase
MPSLPVARLLVFTAVIGSAINLFGFASSGTWTTTASLHTARDGHTATLLSNGNVVVAGGENNNATVASSEVYSPTTGSWTTSGNLNTARANAGAVLLLTGQVLVAGGCISNCLGSTTATAELYNSTAGTWSSTGSMAKARTYFGMVMLSSGKILAAGGCTGLNSNGCSGVTSKAELYDPTTGAWSSTGSMKTARGSFSLTLLPSGKVLAAGGINGSNNPIAKAELYDPTTGTWTATGNLVTARDEHTAILLATGNVLMAGGEDTNSISTANAELYNPSTGTFTATGSMVTGRLEHTAVLLMNGKVLFSGGTKVTSTTTTVLSSSELYDPTAGTFASTGKLSSARTGHTSTLLTSGLVLDASGSGSNNDLKSAELYTP